MDPTYEDFKLLQFLEDTYPTDDDNNEIARAKELLISKYSSFNGGDRFITIANRILDVISKLCKGHSNMDNCDISTIENLCQVFETAKDYMLHQNRELKNSRNMVLHLDALPDSAIFYDVVKRHEIFRKGYVHRSHLQNIYDKEGLQSKFSHVLFCLSWMNFLKVYQNQSIRFINKSYYY